MPKFSPVVSRRRRFSSVLAVLALAVLTAAGCDSSTGNDDSIASLSVNPPTPVLHVGGVQQLVATPSTSSGKIIEGRTPTWNSSNPAVATVDGSGLVTALAGGSTTISASLGGLSDDATVTVWFPVATVTLDSEDGSTTMCQEGSLTLIPTVTDITGAEVEGRQFAWTTGNPDVAFVSPRGELIGGPQEAAFGTTTITAVSEDVSATFDITTNCPPVVDAVELSAPLGSHIVVGDTYQLSAVATAGSGTVLNLAGRAVVWESASPATATVDAAGLVTMLAEGEVEIDVSVDGVEATTLVIEGHANSVDVGTPLTIGTIPADERQIWLVEIPADAESMVVTLGGGTGDPDLRLYPPEGSDTACTSGTSGPNESCTIDAPTAGRWRIDIEAWEGAGDASGTTISVTVTMPTP